jgi:hypothetical protein
MAKKYVVRKVGRDSDSGRFIPVKKAQGRPDAEVETIKYPKK